MHGHLSPFPFSELLYMLCFKNQFKNKKDEGGCNLPHFMQMRCGPQAPAKLLKSLPWTWEVRTQILSFRTERLCWTILLLVDVGQVMVDHRLCVCVRARASWADLLLPEDSEVPRGQHNCDLSVLWLFW